MSIFVTGDLHGANDIHRLSASKFPLGQTLTKNDYLIVAGDFGLVWNFGADELFWRDWLEDRPWTTLFVDGNHENFEALSRLPLESWAGGRVRRLSNSVFHLERGQIYTIDGSTIFVMGGATSIDRELRVPGESWWPQEMPSDAELDEAIANLDAHSWQVDYVITHCCATSLISQVYDGDVWQGPDRLTEWFEILEHKLLFRTWYFGHHHRDRAIPPDHRALFYDVVRLGDLDAVVA